ncbi:pyrophosphatase PpaX [Shouchella clausii]|uniref:pyrophosphatase PpaX n=1 Tax=Shouchella clausii TaxID=79880 RepID=UPI0021481AA3|nr:pyrophosphatase PpaX [Shouchella clausii]MCR1290344.1 pyrophosphatase PpaX [Shouchella clausii]
MTINTLLFDLDGTLIDTNELIIQSFLHTLEPDFPGVYTRETVLPFIGPPLVDSFSRIDASRAEEWVRTYRDFNHQQHDALVKEYPGVKTGIQTLHKQGYKLAVVTTKIRETAQMGLELMGLSPYFDVIVALDDVKHAKPHPEPLLEALRQLDSKPEEAIMVGDNSHDVLAGKAAGTKTVAVGWALKGAEHLRTFAPDYIPATMEELVEIVNRL